MRRPMIVLIVICSLLAAACGGTATTTTTQPSATSETSPPTTAAPPVASSTSTTSSTSTAASGDIAAFCQATTELNTVLLLSALTSLGGPGAQDLQLLTKTPELAAASAEMARTAPPRYAEQAATLAEMYQAISRLADERGLAVSDLADVAADIDDGSTLEELFVGLGIAPDDITQLFEDAAMSLGDREPPVDLVGVDPAELGCPLPDATTGACDLLGDAELVPLVGVGYTTETTDIGGVGEQCTIRGEDLTLIDLTLGGPTFYLPAAWSEIEMIDGVGDEAFLTTGMTWPILYVKQANTVISLTVANVDPRLTVAEIADLGRIALVNAIEANS